MSKGADAGTLQIFIGGDENDVRQALELFHILGEPERVLHVGQLGAGYAVKLMINALWFTQLLAIAEVLTVGVKAGVDVSMLRRSLITSPANSQLLEHDYTGLLVDGDYDESFALALACKDLRLTIDLAQSVGVDVPITGDVRDLFEVARGRYGDHAGEMIPVRLYEDANAVQLRIQRGGEMTHPTGATLPQIGIGPFPAATFGAGSIAGLPSAVKAIGADSVLIVTDHGLAESQLVRRVVALLEESKITVVVFGGIHPNPSTADIDAGGAVARTTRAQAIVSVGGGSALDGAKAIALSATNNVPAGALSWGQAERAGLAIIAVPTTAGTGAECNDFGVITDSSTHRKFYIGAASCLARSVILDPELTISLPPGPTAASGMDCLTHAVESFLSARPNPWADGLDLHVVRLVAANLRRVHADGTDLEARSHMLLAAHSAGQAMSTTGLGIVHGIGHPLGGRHDIAHGVALSLILGGCLRFSRPVRVERLALLADALDAADQGASSDRNADAAIAAIELLAHDVNMPISLAAFGIGADDLAALADDALADVVMVNAPRQPTATDVEQILAAIL